MRGLVAVFAALAALAASSCCRPLETLPISDAARAEAPHADATADLTADVTSAGVCTFDATYRFTTNGGLGATRDAFVLSPPASYVHTRSPEALPYPEVSCAPAIPPCGGAAIDVADIMAALADPDVQAALAQSIDAGMLPFYGEDHRGGDGAAVQITRDRGGGFLVGGPCPTGSSRPCTEAPASMHQLVALVWTFDQQQMTDPSCTFPDP